MLDYAIQTATVMSEASHNNNRFHRPRLSNGQNYQTRLEQFRHAVAEAHMAFAEGIAWCSAYLYLRCSIICLRTV